MAVFTGCFLTPPDTTTTAETKNVVLDTLEFNRKEELAILKAKPTNTVGIDSLQEMVNGILQVRTGRDGRSIKNGNSAIIAGVNKLPELTNERFTNTVRGSARSVENTAVEEDPVELYCFTVEILGEENSGFILTSNDDRIGYILAIVDNGDLADTENPFVDIFMSNLTEYTGEYI